MNDDVKNILKLSLDELKQMDKQSVHEGYKKIVATMLFSFTIDLNNSMHTDITIPELESFINTWLDQHIKPAHPEWQPGDRGV